MAGKSARIVIIILVLAVAAAFVFTAPVQGKTITLGTYSGIHYHQSISCQITDVGISYSYYGWHDMCAPILPYPPTTMIFTTTSNTYAATSNSSSPPACSSATLFQGTTYCYMTESLQSFKVGSSMTFRNVTFTHVVDEINPSYLNVTINLGDGVSGWADVPLQNGSSGGVSTPADGHSAHFIVFPGNDTISLLTNP